MKQNYGTYLFWLGILIGLIGLTRWVKRSSRRKAAEEGKLAEFDAVTKKSSGVSYMVCGAIFILLPLFSWQSIPPGNGPFVMVGALIGLAFILFGWYKIWRSRQQKS